MCTAGARCRGVEKDLREYSTLFHHLGRVDFELTKAYVCRLQYQRDKHPWEGRIPDETDVLITHTPPVSSHCSHF